MFLSSQFRAQLASLLQRISATRPHYVRCLKPNDRNGPDQWHSRRVVNQLRCGGVLEAVRVARAGYPNRVTHAEFLARCAVDPIVCLNRVQISVRIQVN